MACVLVISAGCLDDGTDDNDTNGSHASSLTYAEFRDDYDSSLNEEMLTATSHLRSFDEGDTVVIEDRLAHVIYNPPVDTTTLTFASYPQLDVMAVEGNITDEFALDDIVAITSEIINVTYSYQYQGQNWTVYYETLADTWDIDKETEKPLPREAIAHADDL